MKLMSKRMITLQECEVSRIQQVVGLNQNPKRETDRLPPAPPEETQQLRTKTLLSDWTEQHREEEEEVRREESAKVLHSFEG